MRRRGAGARDGPRLRLRAPWRGAAAGVRARDAGRRPRRRARPRAAGAAARGRAVAADGTGEAQGAPAARAARLCERPRGGRRGSGEPGRPLGGRHDSLPGLRDQRGRAAHREGRVLGARRRRRRRDRSSCERQRRLRVEPGGGRSGLRLGVHRHPGPRDRHRPGRRWRDGRPRADLLLRPVAAAERRGARRGRQPRVPQQRALRLRGAGPHLHLRSVVDGVDRAGPDGARALVPRPGGAARRAHGRARRARRERDERLEPRPGDVHPGSGARRPRRRRAAPGGPSGDRPLPAHVHAARRARAGRGRRRGRRLRQARAGRPAGPGAARRRRAGLGVDPAAVAGQLGQGLAGRAAPRRHERLLPRDGARRLRGEEAVADRGHEPGADARRGAGLAAVDVRDPRPQRGPRLRQPRRAPRRQPRVGRRRQGRRVERLGAELHGRRPGAQARRAAAAGRRLRVAARPCAAQVAQLPLDRGAPAGRPRALGRRRLLEHAGPAGPDGQAGRGDGRPGGDLLAAVPVRRRRQPGSASRDRRRAVDRPGHRRRALGRDVRRRRQRARGVAGGARGPGGRDARRQHEPAQRRAGDHGALPGTGCERPRPRHDRHRPAGLVHAVRARRSGHAVRRALGVAQRRPRERAVRPRPAAGSRCRRRLRPHRALAPDRSRSSPRSACGCGRRCEG